VDAALAFQILNLVVLPWWVTWLVAPRSALALRLASHSAIFLALASLYTMLLIATLVLGPAGGFDYEGIRAVLSVPVGFLAGWTHYLVFDLFVGAWILRESRRIDVEARPYLFFTLMAGPIGLGSFLVRRWLRLRTLGQIGEVDLI
jgi:hypothetical protein